MTRLPSRLPRHAGVGFKPQHFAAIRADPQPPAFFEVHAENYMGAGGPPHAQLAALRADHAISIHGVGLSIGGRGRWTGRVWHGCGRSATAVTPRASRNTWPICLVAEHHWDEVSWAIAEHAWRFEPVLAEVT